jgi:hypothetical protein
LLLAKEESVLASVEASEVVREKLPELAEKAEKLEAHVEKLAHLESKTCRKVDSCQYYI